MAFIISCLLCAGSNYMHNSLMGKMRLPFIDSDLLYRGALLASGSIPVVGSSRNTIGGLPTNAIAVLSFLLFS
jgi:hypothetical protein